MENNGKTEKRPGQHLRPETAAKRRPARAVENGSSRPARPQIDRPEKHLSRSQRLYREKLMPTLENMHQRNLRSLHAGVAWLFGLPVLLAVIRHMTDSNKIAFLIIWIVGMFLIAGALVFVAFSDHQLKGFKKELQDYVPEAEDLELSALLPVDAQEGLNIGLSGLTLPTEQLREAILARRAERHDAETGDGDDGAEAKKLAADAELLARLQALDEWLKQRREKGPDDEKHPEDHQG